jgi:hypothetical protein
MPDNTPTGVGKLKRSYLLHYVNANMTVNDNSPSWFLIGKDVDDFPVNLNPELETKKNIWDETVTDDKGYQPSADVGTYYANTGEALYAPLKNIAMNRLTGDACRTDFLEVIVDTTGTSHSAWREAVVIKPQSYGGPQGGVNIPYNITFDGGRKSGTATIDAETKAPTFTVATQTE